MITETYYSVKVEKITKGVRETNSWERLYSENHPKVKDGASEYGIVQKAQAFKDTEILLDQRCESVEIERVLKAINRGLRE